MVGPKSGRSGYPSSSDPEDENLHGLRAALGNTEGVYKYTRIQTGAIGLVDYKESTDEEDKYSAIGESDSSSSSANSTSAYMTGNADEMAKKVEEQSLIQKMQHEMLIAQ